MCVCVCVCVCVSTCVCPRGCDTHTQHTQAAPAEAQCSSPVIPTKTPPFLHGGPVTWS